MRNYKKILAAILSLLLVISAVPVVASAGEEPDYLTLTGTQEFSLSFSSTLWKQAGTGTGVVEYSTDKITWTEITSSSDIAGSGAGKVIYLRGKNNALILSTMLITPAVDGGTVAASGNIMTLLDYEDPSNATMTTRCFYGLFSGCEALTSAPSLPATTLVMSCYNSMFSGCTNLLTPPELPADTLASSCYYKMFSGCTSLTSMPLLPDGSTTVLETSCYSSMFEGCANLEIYELNPGEGYIPISFEYSVNCVANMFKDTGGDSIGTPQSGTVYYVKDASAAPAEDNSVVYLDYNTVTNSLTAVTTGTYNLICAETNSLPGPGVFVVSGEVTTGQIRYSGDVTIIILDGASLNASGINSIDDDSSITITAGNFGNDATKIKGTGTLVSNATQLSDCAGIGGTFSLSERYIYETKAITINAVTVTANGGPYAAGIGSGLAGKGNNITINGGTVYATGGDEGAGIGSGAKYLGYGGSANNITVNSGTVTAYGGKYAAGIGGGNGGNSSNIVINDGIISATGGEQGAGIGSGPDADAEGITINGGTVTAYGGKYGAGIGSGAKGAAKNITINDGTVTATGGYCGAGIGSGVYGAAKNITVNDGTVTAAGGYCGAGIGSGLYNDAEDMTINGGTVTAYGGDFASAIGGGCGGSLINFTAGNSVIKAVASQQGPAIGAGNAYDEDTLPIVNGITLNDGVYDLTGGYFTDVLGGCYTSEIKNVSINNGLFTLTPGVDDSDPDNIISYGFIGVGDCDSSVISDVVVNNGYFNMQIGQDYVADGKACLEDIDSSNKDDYGYRIYNVYDVDTVFDSAKGSVSLDTEYYREGDTATATVTPKGGYQIDALTAFRTGDETAALAITGGKVTVPAYGITIKATFKYDDDVQAVIDAIDGLDVSTLDDREDVEAARDLYEQLDDDQKAVVENIAELEDAEEEIEDLEEIAEVIGLIDDIGEVDKDSGDAIEAAREAYDALSDEQKVKVTNAETLENAEKEFEDIKAAEEVIALIEEIGEVGYDSKNAIKAAREAYEALTDDQKAMVSNIDTLTAAEETYAQLPPKTLSTFKCPMCDKVTHNSVLDSVILVFHTIIHLTYAMLDAFRFV